MKFKHNFFEGTFQKGLQRALKKRSATVGFHAWSQQGLLDHNCVGCQPRHRSWNHPSTSKLKRRIVSISKLNSAPLLSAKLHDD